MEALARRAGFQIWGLGHKRSHDTQSCQQSWPRLPQLPPSKSDFLISGYILEYIWIAKGTQREIFSNSTSWTRPAEGPSGLQASVVPGFLSVSLGWLWSGLQKSKRPNQYNYRLSVTYCWEFAISDYPQWRRRAANTSTSIGPEHYIYACSGVWEIWNSDKQSPPPRSRAWENTKPRMSQTKVGTPKWPWGRVWTFSVL